MICSAYIPHSDGWLFVTTGTLIIGVALADDSPLLPELWALAEGGAEPGVVLDALTRGGISAAPDFVIATLGEAAKVLVRGAATVAVAGSDAVTLAGTGFSSWVERSFDRVDSVSCEVIGSDRVTLPLLSGAVRAGWFGAAVAGVAAFTAAGLSPAERVETDPVLPPLIEPSEPEPEPEPEPQPEPIRGRVPEPVVDRVVVTASTAETLLSETTVMASPDEEDDDEAPAEPAKPTAYDFLFGETAYRTVEEAAVRPIAEDDDPAKPGIEDRTVVASDLAQLRAQRRAGRGRTTEATEPVAAFYLELSTGGQEKLDQPLVIGRAPSATALAGGKIPRLVTMTTPNQDISRTHAQISVEGGTVVVTDLHSSNGTIVTLPGRSAQKLREGETTPVIPGTIIDLGDGATLTVREA